MPPPGVTARGGGGDKQQRGRQQCGQILGSDSQLNPTINTIEHNVAAHDPLRLNLARVIYFRRSP